MKKLDAVLFSDRGMKLVNTLFLLSCFLRSSGFIVVAYAVWIAYLSSCIRRSDAKSLRMASILLAVFAGVMIFLNLYFLLRAL